MSMQLAQVPAGTRPTILLLDLNLAGASGAAGRDLCAALTSAHPDGAVLVLTAVIDDQLVRRALHNGARGYVVKEVDTAELARAIRGEPAVDSRSSATVRSIHPAPAGQQLTAREREVLRLLAGGLSNRDIGRRLYISETTAKFHVGNILRKLRVTRRAEAVYLASKSGMI